MSFLKEFLPAPVVDLALPVLLVGLVAYFALPPLFRKLKEMGVVDRALDKVGGEKLRQMQFDREIARLKKQGNFLAAAQLYEDAEWYQEALNLYLEGEEYIAAGALYEKLEQWEQAAEMYLKASDWKRAAKIYVTAGRQEKAADLYAQQGQKIDGAKLYFEARRYDKAAELYEAASYFQQAGQAFEKIGQLVRAGENYEKHWAATTSFGGGGLIASPSDRESRAARLAGQLYERGGALDRAAAIYARAGLSKEAAQISARLGRFDEAGEMLLRVEELGPAAEMFEKAGEVERAALLRGEVAFRGGEPARAAQEFFKGRDYLRAAELFETVGDLASAASCFEKSDSPIQAANVYLRADRKAEAAAMFERGRDYETAGRLYEEIGKGAEASNLFEKAGRFFEAGKLARSLGQQERAIKLLQQIDSADENYEGATLILSRLFIERNMAGLAAEKLQRLLGSRSIGSQTLEHFYCLGLAYEKLGKKEQAIETYKRILAERYGYEDVEERITTLSAPAAPTPPFPPSPRPQPAAATSPRQPLAPPQPPAATASRQPSAASGPPPIAAPHPGRPFASPPSPAAPQRPASTPSPSPTPHPPQIAPVPQPQPAPSSAPAPQPTRAPVPIPAPPARPPASVAPPAGASLSPGSKASAAVAAPSTSAAAPLEVAEELGRGLLGPTFKGVDTRTQRPVAIKFIRKELLQDRQVVQSFLTEVRVARQFDHPNLVRLLGLAEIRGEKAVVMEYVDGVSLASILARSKRLTLKQAVDLLTTLCMALGYAHERNLLHRDLKMTNVLVSQGGKLRICGFGLGALRTGALGPGEGYPPPELLAGKPSDARSDLYSLGAMLFHGLSGLHPQGQATAEKTSGSVRELVPAVPEPLDQIISRCLAQDPAARFNNVTEILAASRSLRT